ncbi:hypothetical protein QL285_007737 [Trifolium repens]|nr:hypothetical protein QL285_007737 [Trifolium repens]
MIRIRHTQQPSSFTVKPLLTGSNYNSWERSIRPALYGKMKFEFVDGMIVVVTDQFNPTYYALNKCNMVVHSWIINSVTESIGQSMENELDMWMNMKERFAQGDLIRISEIMQVIYSLQQYSKDF